jgi:hypothetical protein
MADASPKRRFRRRPARTDGPGALGLLEEAVALIRTAPAELLGLYYAGSAPFVLGFLFFWAEMSRGAYARERCAGYALLLAILFCFMKAGQALFAARVRRLARREPEPAWSWRGAGRVLISQALLQPAGLVVLPLAGLAVLPFAHMYAYYAHLGAMSDEAGLDWRGLRRRAWEQARLQPLQNGVLVWLTCPWIMAALFAVAWTLAHGLILLAPPGAAPASAPLALGVLLMFFMWPLNPLCMALAVNLAVALLAAPFLLLKLAGVESIFTLSQEYAALNTTFLAVIFGLVYLVADPLAKAAFALKGFHGESLRTGADLRARLAGFREARRAAVAGGRACLLALLAFFFIPSFPGWASGSAPLPNSAARASGLGAQPSPAAVWTPADFDAAARRVLEGRDYRWRLRRVQAAPRQARWWGWLADSRLVLDLRDALRRFADWGAARGRAWSAWWNRWARRLFGAGLPPGELHLGRDLWFYAGVFVLAAALLASLAILVRRWRRRVREIPVQTVAGAPAVDLAQEQVSADRLPPDEWLDLARSLLDRGERRLAMRAFFLSGLAFLARRELVRLAPAKTNRDYARELARFQEPCPGLVAAFQENTGTFDRVWYGDHPITPDALTRFTTNLDRMRAHAPSV